jgi:hypothetical protein
MKKKKKFIKLFLSLLSGICKNSICSNCQFFSGQMPINLSREKFEKIRSKDYLALEKSNGFRFLFFVKGFCFYFIDRNFSIHRTIKFKNNNKKYTKKITIYDGEISYNLIRQDFDLILYDIICYNDDWRVSTWDLNGRVNIINKIKNQQFLNKWEKNNLKKKDFFLKMNIKFLFEQIYSNHFSNEFIYINKNLKDTYICNKNDGVIFAHNKSSYFTKFPNNIFKWKCEKEISLDFLSKKISIKNSERKFKIIKSALFCQGFRNNLILVKKTKKRFFFKKKRFFFINKKKIKIKEYIFVRKKGKWYDIKNRPDKNKPNSFKVILNTLENIIESFFKFEIIDKTFKQNLRKKRGKIFFGKFFFLKGC